MSNTHIKVSQILAGKPMLPNKQVHTF